LQSTELHELYLEGTGTHILAVLKTSLTSARASHVLVQYSRLSSVQSYDPALTRVKVEFSMAEPDASELSTFPTDPDVFDDDERISFSKLDSKYVAVQENGTELEFDAELKRWIPIIDEALIEEQQSGYGELEPELDTSRPVQARKRKKDEREVSCD
jgi:hypothetical protein